MAACPSDTRLLAYAHGVRGVDGALIDEHLDACSDCRLVVVAALGNEASSTLPPVPSTLTPEDEPLPGAMLGRYRLLERIGRGGMGVVFAASDPQLQRRVAVKLLNSLGSKRHDERLLREAQALARLEHPNVVGVYDTGHSGDRPFIVMQLIEGVTLRRWLEREQRSWRTIVATFVEAGRGLEAAHAAGLVHRDFKPENVLIDREGRARVTDFGLVSRVNELEERPLDPSALTTTPERLTETNAVVGTPAYVAPELLAGTPASPASDQFSFCIALFEALSGFLPFAGQTVREQRDNAVLGQLRPSAAAVPRWIHGILRRGLSGDPNERFSSLGALLDALERDPAVRRRRWMGGVGLAAIAAASIGAVVQHQRTLCDGLESELEAAFSPALRDRAERAFASVGHERTWTFVDRRLSAYARRWLDTRRSACESAKRDHTLTPAQHTVAESCLRERLDDLTSLTSTLGSADSKMVDRALDAVDSLENIETCTNLAIISHQETLFSRATADDVRMLRAGLRSARLAALAGDVEKSAGIAEAVASEARSKQVLALAAEAEWVRGMSLSLVAKPEGVAVLEEAVRLGAESGDESVMVRTLATLIRERAKERGKPEAALALVPVATGLAARVGTARERATLEEALGDLEFWLGHFEQSLGHRGRALEFSRRALGEDSLAVARGYARVAQSLTELGRIDEAQLQIGRSLTLYERTLGPDNPQILGALDTACAVEEARGDAEALVRCAEREARLVERLRGAGSEGTFVTQINFANALSAAGRPEQSGAVLSRLTPPARGRSFRRLLWSQAQAKLATARGQPLSALAFATEEASLARALFATEIAFAAMAAHDELETLLANRAFGAAETVASATLASDAHGGIRARLEARLTEALAGAGKWDEACPAFDAALRRFDSMPGLAAADRSSLEALTGRTWRCQEGAGVRR